jgi:hypothetical protein
MKAKQRYRKQAAIFIVISSTVPVEISLGKVKKATINTNHILQ